MYFCRRHSETLANLKLKFIAQLTSNCSRKSRKWSGLFGGFAVRSSAFDVRVFSSISQCAAACYRTSRYTLKTFPNTFFHCACLFLPARSANCPTSINKKKNSRGKPMKSEWKIKSTCVFFGLRLCLDDDIKR